MNIVRKSRKGSTFLLYDLKNRKNDNSKKMAEVIFSHGSEIPAKKIGTDKKIEYKGLCQSGYLPSFRNLYPDII